MPRVQPDECDEELEEDITATSSLLAVPARDREHQDRPGSSNSAGSDGSMGYDMSLGTTGTVGTMAGGRRSRHGEYIELETLTLNTPTDPEAGADAPDTLNLLPIQGRVVEIHEVVAPQSNFSFFMEVFPSLLLAGGGVLAAGVLLDIVQHWQLFIEVDELLTVVPALLGLKGSLEMTLASRLSTAAHLGELQGSQKWDIISGNLLLIQVQAIIVAVAASVLAIILSALVEGEFSIAHTGLLMGASIAAASIASLFLGGVMCGIVTGSRYLKINPDNIATPIAASLGDLVTLSILVGFGLLLFMFLKQAPWACVFFIATFLFGVLPCALHRISKNRVYLDILKTKWTWICLLLAMCISSMAGLILEQFNVRFPGLAALSPVINGIGGNLGAVQASRISSALHSGSRAEHTQSALILFALVVPISALFLGIINASGVGHTSMSLFFLQGYMLAAMFQVAVLLFVAKKLVKFIWRQNLDPDNIAIPLVTALGDFLGTASLTICFIVLWSLGDQDADVGD
eukprot:m.132558 g.132558  ORF g.132558 m.132558 type:complete len:517 (-) comp20070_c0_seq1:46-1596(-)